MKKEQDRLVSIIPWDQWIQAALQKLGSTVISAKVLVIGTAFWTSTYLVLTTHPVYQYIEGQIIITQEPYLTGAEWCDFNGLILVAFIGARIAPKLIGAIGDAIAVARNGN